SHVACFSVPSFLLYLLSFLYFFILFFFSFVFFLFFFLMIRRPPRSTLFPYTRSSDLQRPSSSSSKTMLKDSDSGCCGTVAMTLRSEEHTSELQSRVDLVCRLLLEKKKKKKNNKILYK